MDSAEKVIKNYKILKDFDGHTVGEIVPFEHGTEQFDENIQVLIDNGSMELAPETVAGGAANEDEKSAE